MRSFLDESAERILSAHDDLRRVAVIFQTKRAKLFFKRHLASLRPHRSSWLPELFTIEEWIERLTQRTITEDLPLLLKLYDAYRECGGDRDPEAFWELGEKMLSDFNDVDRYAVDAGKLFKDLDRLRELDHWGSEPSQFQQQSLDFWKIMAGLYGRFRETLRDHKMAYAGMLYRETAEASERVWSEIPWEKLYFLGFNALSTTEERIIRSGLTGGKAEMLWDADEYYVQSAYHEAGRFIRQYVEDWKVPYRPPSHFGNGKKTITLTGVPKRMAQAEAVGRILQSLPDGNSEQTAVVLGDDALLLPILEAVPGNIPSINVSMGYPLAQTPVYQWIQALFELYDTAKDQRFHHEETLAVIDHPYFRAVAFEHSVRMKRSFTEANLTWIDGSEVRTEETGLDALFGVLTEPLDILRRMVDSVKAFQAYFERRSMTFEIELLSRTKQILAQILEWLHPKTEIQLPGLIRKIVLNALGTSRIPFDGEPLKGIQVMGVLETRSLDFDTVIFTSVNEGVIPGPRTHQSLIPFEKRVEFGLPNYTEKEAIFAYNFYRLLQRANQIFFIYNAVTEDLGQGERSRFVLQLLDELPKAGSNISIIESTEGNRPLASKAWGDHAINKDPYILEALRRKMNDGLSPSALNEYITCPYHFYLKRIVRLKESDQIEEQIEADRFGTIVHAALQELFAPYRGQILTSSVYKELLKRTTGSIEKAFREEAASAHIAEGKNRVLAEMAKKLIQDFVRTQGRIHVETGATVHLDDVEMDLRHTLSVAGRSFVLTGKSDRIETHSDCVRVIDYKTGKVERSELKLESIEDAVKDPKKRKAFQLLAYAYLYHKNHPTDKPLSGVVFSFRKTQSGYIPLSIDERTLLNAEDFRMFEESLLWLINDMLDETKPIVQTQNKDDCKYCEFAVICHREQPT